MQGNAGSEVQITESRESLPGVKEADHVALGLGAEENGDGFSDISDSEFLSLQEDTLMERDVATCVAEKSVQPREGGIKSLGKNDDNAGTSAALHHAEEKSNDRQPDPGGVLQRKRKQELQTPLEKYNMKYLWVTNLCSQTWCEQQMVYEFEYPELLKEKSHVMNAGASIHLARELEVHDVVSVTTQTKEDSWAIKFLNVLSMIPILQSGGCVREFPVFREIDGVFLVGVIDELGYSPKGELELRELKTRAAPSLPGTAQKISHQFQVSLYKVLFDGMVRGLLQPDPFIQHLRLKPDQVLGTQVKDHIKRAGFTVATFRDLLELTCLNLTFSDLPVIDCLKLEYCYQEDSTSLGCEMVSFEEETVMKHLEFYLSYWKGLRQTQGVDIEDAWKCRNCCFANICEWRAMKSKEATLGCLTKRSK
ncbi:exonuclease V [Rhinophrynus dorsalis]